MPKTYVWKVYLCKGAFYIMNRIVRTILVITGAVFVMGLFGCVSQKYKVNFDDGDFELKKKSYPAGETVTAYFPYVATDTDYSFYIKPEDTKLDISFDEQHGYVLSFTMPAHDVSLSYDSRNTMEYDPEAQHKYSTENNTGIITISYVNEISTADVWIIADIEENHKTSLWGTATLKDAEPEKEYSADIEKSADDHYLLRMIDKDELYYESGSFELRDGYSLLVSEGESFQSPHIVIYDDNGENSEELTIFRAAL